MELVSNLDNKMFLSVVKMNSLSMVNAIVSALVRQVNTISFVLVYVLWICTNVVTLFVSNPTNSALNTWRTRPSLWIHLSINIRGRILMGLVSSTYLSRAYSHSQSVYECEDAENIS